MDEETERAINEAVHIVQQEQGVSRPPVEAYVMEEHPEEEAQGPQEPPTPKPAEQETATPQPEAPGSRRRLWFVALVVVLVSVTMLLILAVPPLLQPVATITVIPTVRTVTIATPVQVQGRVLASLTLTQARSDQTTGTAEQQAQAATGTITFYNALPAVQTVPAGTLLTGGDGIQVVTEQEAVIPAGNLTTNGQVSVRAHSVQVGPQGNIAAGDIYGACCRANVFVSNGAFRGGQNARRYRMVTQSDVDHAAKTLEAVMTQSITATFQAQRQPGEAVTPATCHATTARDHKVGEEATQFTTTLTATCSALAYQTQAVQDQVTHALTTQAAVQLGDGYTLTGDPHVTVTHSSSQGSILTLQVKAQGTFAYQFQGRLQTIKQQIAGMSKQEATAFLTHQPGVSAVSLDISSPFGVNTSTIPQDRGAIHITVLYASPS